MNQSPSANQPQRLAVLISGGGRTLLNLQDAIDRGELDAVIPIVIASKECAGVERARARGLPTLIYKGEIPAAELESVLEPHAIDWIVLAGYLKKVHIPKRYRGRIVNIHPALLPSHGGPGMYGHHVHEAVIKAKDTQSGCTVHLCDEEYDRGEIILQLTCPVQPDDTPDTLAARVFEVETRAYPQALRMLFDRTTPPAHARSEHR